MINIKDWLFETESKIKTVFNDNLCFFGYQGSYRRKEAAENSDIDLVIILDKLTLQELKKYKDIVKTLPHSEKVCGFISGKEELKNWSKHELFQLYNDTEALYGNLKDFIPKITLSDAEAAAKSGAETIYHAACHSFLFSNDKKSVIKELYKSVFFVLQAKYFAERNMFLTSKKDLLKKLSPTDKEILEISIERNNIDEYPDEKICELYKKIINFCSDIICKNSHTMNDMEKKC